MTDAKKKATQFHHFRKCCDTRKKKPAYTEFLMRKCVKVIIHSISMTKLKNYITAYVYIYCALKCITLNCKKKNGCKENLELIKIRSTLGNSKIKLFLNRYKLVIVLQDISKVS